MHEVVKSQEYVEQLNNPVYPILANSFLCSAILHCESKNFAAASWSHIHAAWTCDDSKHTDQASACRQKAAEMIRIAEENKQPISKQIGGSTAILIDLLRRSGQIEQAEELLVTLPDKPYEDIIDRILNFQRILLQRGDLNCHTIEEVLSDEA